jgi:hypothetical protein
MFIGFADELRIDVAAQRHPAVGAIERRVGAPAAGQIRLYADGP